MSFWSLTPCRTPAEIRSFVQGVADERIFTDYHLPSRAGQPYPTDAHLEELVAAFPALVFNLPIPVGFLDKVGVVWGLRHLSAPTAIPGVPALMSCRFMPVEDWRVVKGELRRELARRGAAERYLKVRVVLGGAER